MGKIILKIDSDWHVGSGTGQTGNIDRLVLRDGEGFPFIPAKTLTGIWRDACEQVAFGLDNGEENKLWYQWLVYLFGDQPALQKGPIASRPRPAALSVRAANLPACLRKALICRPEVKQALTFIKPGVSIDPETGTAKTDFLRFEEMVRCGTILEASFSLPHALQSTEYDCAIAFLQAGAAFVERLGAKRRRGAGRCCMSLSDLDLNIALKWLEKNTTPPDIPKLETVKLSAKLPDRAPASEPWYKLELQLDLLSPVLAYNRQVGNVIETLDYIPGTYLLSAIYRRLRHHGLDLSEAIARGDLLVTHATLAVSGTRGLPVPFAWFSEKLNPQHFYNLFSFKASEIQRQVKGCRRGYVTGSEPILPQTVRTILGTHNVIDDPVQRPTEDVGGVYSYQAIAPGTSLRAELRLRQSLVDRLHGERQDWVNLLEEDTYHLGRANKDDYGLVQVKIVKQLESITPAGNTNPPQPPLERGGQDTPPFLRGAGGDPNSLTVWLLSDALLRDKRLRYSAQLADLQDTLSQSLGVTLQERNNSNVLSSLTRPHRTESWQKSWGFPRPSLVGLAAGTCVVYDVVGTLNPQNLADLDQNLADLEITGIGDRRVEGYGQLSFNHPLLSQKEFTLSAASTPQAKLPKFQPISSPGPIYDYAKTLEKAAWLEAIRKQAIALAADPKKRKNLLSLTITETPPISQPSLSQLGAFRSLVFQMQDSGNNDSVLTWLDNAYSKQKWSQESCDRAKDILTNDRKVWQYLGLKYRELTVTEAGVARLQEKLWVKAVQILIDACIRSHKRDFESRKSASS